MKKAYDVIERSFKEKLKILDLQRAELLEQLDEFKKEELISKHGHLVGKWVRVDTDSIKFGKIFFQVLEIKPTGIFGKNVFLEDLAEGGFAIKIKDGSVSDSVLEKATIEDVGIIEQHILDSFRKMILPSKKL